jgi:hypothetical protein
MALTLYRSDHTVTDPMGNPVSGVTVYCLNQPATTTSNPPFPLAPIYADAAGTIPLDQVTAGGVLPNGALRPSQQVQTNAQGEASFYALPGIYTFCYYSPQMAPQTMTLVDQIVSSSTNLPQYNNDTSSNGSIIPSPNGVQLAFTLSAAPQPPSSLILALNGAVVLGYGFSGQTVVFEVAPKTTDVISATYAV